MSFHVVFPDVSFDSPRAIQHFLSGISLPAAVDRAVYSFDQGTRLFTTVGAHKPLPTGISWDGAYLRACHTKRAPWDHLITFTGGTARIHLQPDHIARNPETGESDSQRRRLPAAVTSISPLRSPGSLPEFLSMFDPSSLRATASSLLQTNCGIATADYRWTTMRQPNRDTAILTGRPTNPAGRFCPLAQRKHGSNAFSCSFRPSGLMQYNCTSVECMGKSISICWVSQQEFDLANWLQSVTSNLGEHIDEGLLGNLEV